MPLLRRHSDGHSGGHSDSHSDGPHRLSIGYSCMRCGTLSMAYQNRALLFRRNLKKKCRALSDIPLFLRTGVTRGGRWVVHFSVCISESMVLGLGLLYMESATPACSSPPPLARVHPCMCSPRSVWRAHPPSSELCVINECNEEMFGN